MNSGSAAEFPVWIDREDQFLRQLDYISLQRYPIELGNNDLAARPKNSQGLRRRDRAIEPMQALARGD